MKKLILILTTALSFSFSHAKENESTVYQVYQSEFYIYNKETEKWDLEARNKDVNISMVFYKDAINIQALTPTLFKVKTNTKKSISGNGFVGYSFEALECVEERVCKVEYIYLLEYKDKFILSIIHNDKTLGKVNLRYYSTLN